MKNVMLAEPSTIALFGMGLFLLFILVLLGGIIFLIAYFSRKPGKTAPPTAPPPPVYPKTEVMPRKCPQCGATLQPDAPEGLCPACLLQHGFATEGGAPSGPSSFVPPPIPELAALFPQLEILECLGRGGMGAVYKARQPRLDRLVALKILAPEKQNDLQFAERFEREARALARLNHPNIVTVFDFGEVSGRFYLLMEFVDGLTLRQLLQAGKIAPAEALNIVPKICEALQYAHEHGIVHRDIKPENILLDKSGRVKIADFGIAKIAGLESKDFSLTGAKDVMGTPHYMAPEQIEKPLTVDHRADIYSLGVVFYEMLTGELPLGKFALPSQKVHVDVRLDEVVLHALEKEPARRYQHASQVKTDVETVASSMTAAAGQTSPLPLPAALVNTASDKIILPAFLLAFFFGVFGAHRFYVGKTGTAILQLCTLGGLGIWCTIDWILILCKAFTDGQGRRISNWIHPGASVAKPAAPAFGGGNPNPPQANGKTADDRSDMIVAPAVALMIAGLWKLLSALTAVFVLTSVGGWLGNFAGIGNLSGTWGSVAIFSVVLFKIIPGLLILFGGYQMLQRQSYSWAIAAGIISIISCSLIGFPAGIWALIVLARDDVKSAFGTNVSAAPLAPQPDRFGRGFAVIAGWVVLILIALTFIAAIAVVFMPEVRSAVGWNRSKIIGGFPYGPMDVTPEHLQQAGIVQGANGEYRKDASQSFPLNADGRFSLDNVKGRIEIHGWSSNAVVINAAIHGKTGESVDAVKINIDSDLDRAVVHTEQPSSVTTNHNLLPDLWNWLWFKNDKRNDASVDYTIQVPQQARLADISSVNGRIVIDSVAGDIAASTVNGETQIKNAVGNLELSTVNGTITADMNSLGSGQRVSLSAVNGKIKLAVPENAAAKFFVSTINGGITSEFPSLQPKREFPVGNKLNGSLGHGGATVEANAVNGTVKILKRPGAQPISTNLPPSTLLAYSWRTEPPATNVPVLPADEKSRTVSTNAGAASIVENPAVAAARGWLALIDAGNYSESWKQASAFFQGAVTEAVWENSMTTFRKPLGELVSRQLKSAQPMTELPGAADGQYVVMQFETSFANKKSAIETVTFALEKDGQWKSAGYFIK
jgi:tRNA A-37 threonylcarbamoyl transferase component Bud32/TM2 domain-containing membrane protein YozV